MNSLDDLPRFKGVWEDARVVMKEDDYMPFVFDASARPEEAQLVDVGHVYVQAKDPNDGLLDAKFHLPTGRLLSLQVVNLPKQQLQAPDLDALQASSGLPIFDSLLLDPESAQPARRATRAIASCTLPDGGLYVSVDPNHSPSTILRADRLFFTFLGSSWIGFGRS